jgi:hypothetical protein
VGQLLTGVDSIFIGEDADHVGASFDLAVEAFERIDGMKFRLMVFLGSS